MRAYQLRRLAVAMAVLQLGPWDVTGEHLVAWMAAQTWGLEFRRGMRSAVRCFYRWAAETGRYDGNPALQLPVVEVKPPCPKPAPLEVYQAALRGANTRLTLVLRLAVELGMRRGEVARVHVRELEREYDGYWLRILGKGSRVRRVPVHTGLAHAIREAGAESHNGYLFPGQIDGHLAPATVGKLVSRAMPDTWAMHSLRHRFATVAYADDRDLLTVQTLLGHASPVTTRRYVQVPDGSLRRAAAAVAAAS